MTATTDRPAEIQGGQLTMDNELLYAKIEALEGKKIEALEGKRPLTHGRSRR
jgi:hypothetical protein